MAAAARQPKTARPATRRQGGLGDEIGKRDPFDHPAHEALLSVMKTHDQLAAQHAGLFAEHDLSSPLYNILRILRGHELRTQGDTAGKQGVPVYTVGREMITRVPDITRLADRLEKLGHVERRRCPDDRRVVRLHLTTRGRRLAEKLVGPTLDLAKDQFAHLSARETTTLIRLLHKVRRPPGNTNT